MTTNEMMSDAFKAKMMRAEALRDKLYRELEGQPAHEGATVLAWVFARVAKESLGFTKVQTFVMISDAYDHVERAIENDGSR